MVHQACTAGHLVFCCLKQWIRLRYPAVASIEAEQLERILAGDEAVDWLILDARTPAEFAFSHLGGAALVEADGLMAVVGSITTLPRDRPIVVCCSVGVRSAARVDQLRRAGFSRTFNLEGACSSGFVMGALCCGMESPPCWFIHTIVSGEGC